jgi:hypothetical protein
MIEQSKIENLNRKAIPPNLLARADKVIKQAAIRGRKSAVSKILKKTS